MKAPLAFTLSLAIALPIGVARAEEPPVDVEILGDEAQDFFSEPEEEEEEEQEKSDDKDAKRRVKKNADAAFDELEAHSKGAKIRRAKRSDDSGDDSSNDNINQNVINVVVVSGDKETKAEAKNEAKSEVKTEQPATVVPAPVETKAEPPPAKKDPPPAAKQTDANQAEFYGHNTWKSWWEKKPNIGSGDVLFFVSSGGYGGGLYLGLGFEGMFSNWGGLRFTVHGTGFDKWDDGDSNRGWRHRDDDDDGPRLHLNRGDWDFFLGGRTVAPTVAEGAVSDAFLHLEDLSLAFHFGGDHGFDLSPSIGVSHFGYHLNLEDGPELNGGSGFLRAGAAAQWVYKRFFAGVDLGWYPVELFRYGVEDRGDRESEFVEREIDDPFDRRRITFSAFAGLAL